MDTLTEKKPDDREPGEGEERYRTILRTAMDGFCILDRQGQFIEVNEAFSRMLGYTLRELKALSLMQIEGEETPYKISNHLEKITGTGSGRFETRYQRKDRTIIDVEVSVVSSDKNPGGFFTFHRDITERKKAEEILRDTNEAFSQAQELAHVGSWKYDLKQNVIQWSDELYRVFGYTPGEFDLKLENIRERIHPEDLEKHDRILANAVESQVYEPGEYRIIHPDGTPGFISTKGSAIVDQSGTVTHLMGVVQDITERRVAEEKILHVNRSLALMTDITYQDIQNKVTALRGYVELMKKAVSEDDRLSFLNAQREILGTLHHLITNTKDYQRIGMEDPRWIPLESTIRKEVSALEWTGKIHLEIHLDTLEVWSEPLIARVFNELLKNAAKQGKALTRLTLGFQENPDGLLLICEDNGPGIPRDEKEHIFDRIVAGEGRFGLFFVHEFLTASGMTVRETGEPGSGARFEIHIPKRMYRFVNSTK